MEEEKPGNESKQGRLVTGLALKPPGSPAADFSTNLFAAPVYVEGDQAMQSTLHGITPQALADLHDLVQINLDSAEGFETTATLVQSPHYADLFHTIARQRNDFASELNRLIVSYGDRPEASGSLLGKAHKWWIDLRFRLNDGDDKVVMIEAERAEDRILALYEKALAHGLPEPIIEIIDRQLLLVRQDHDHIRALRDALNSAG